MTVTTDEAQTGPEVNALPPEVEAPPCSYCSGTGREPSLTDPAARGRVTTQLRKLSAPLEERRYLRGRNGDRLRAEVHEKIRPLIVAGEALGMTQEECSELLGIGRMALYNIMAGKVGGQATYVRTEKAEARRKAVRSLPEDESLWPKKTIESQRQPTD